jgi:transcriptional regulator
MYIPEVFRETQLDVLHSFIRAYSFGTLVSRVAGELFASHLPLLLDSERGSTGTLVGHMARANPHWQGFEEPGPVLALFQGPHAYISPSWYATELSVPTWNYVAVHASGTPRIIRDREQLLHLLDRTVRTYESGFETPWQISRLPESFVEKLSAAIVGFEIPIERLEGKVKLGQNRSREDREGMLAGLAAGADPLGHELAELMKRLGSG